MNDKELLGKLVALGVVDILPEGSFAGFQYLTPGGDQWRSIGDVLEDWSVAGALMEKCVSTTTANIDGKWAICATGPVIDGLSNNESLPRAIIEACVTVLDKEK